MNDQVTFAALWVKTEFPPAWLAPAPPGILIEAVPFDTVAVTPLPTKSKNEADPCVLPSSKIYNTFVPPPPPFKANEAVVA